MPRQNFLASFFVRKQNCLNKYYPDSYKDKAYYGFGFVLSFDLFLPVLLSGLLVDYRM